MTDASTFILNVLSRDFSPARLNETVDWETIAKVSRKHRLSALLLHDLSRMNDPRFATLMTLLRPDHFEVARQYMALNRQQKTLTAALNDEQIPFLFFKGLSLASLYPLPHLRAMNDLDVLITPEDRSRVHHLLTSIGHELVKKTLNEWIYRFDGVLVEVHTRLIHPSDTTPEIARYFETAGTLALESGRDLSANQAYVFLLVHLIKHLEGTGAGWRFMVDLAYARKNLDLDENALIDTLKALKIETFSSVVDGVLQRRFGMKLKSTAQPTQIDRLEGMLDGEGLFGHQDKLLAKATRLNRNSKSRLKTWLWPEGLTFTERLERLMGWIFHPKQTFTKLKVIRASKNQAEAWLDDLQEIGL